MAHEISDGFLRLIERRHKFIDGLDANRGEINLDIFEDFYPDRAHFVYELLQNAEDAGATEVTFALMSDRLICEHDGRPFTLGDVTSITGVHDSTKVTAQDKIGKFGVGFKSVFVYTQAPSVRSGDFAFRIVKLILPEPIAPAPELGHRTRFEFPFDNPKKPAYHAYDEIAAGLEELDEKTLLFLSSLRSVKWRIGTESTGKISRFQHSDFHFEVLKETGKATTANSHFLKFDEVVPGLGKQRVAVAFPLDALPDVRQFEQKKPLAEQFKIVPASPGRVAVFFPATKEASGLRFHLHGPFVPELSRASIKDTEVNLPLFEQLATLTAKSLHQIKELGLLTTEFLAVLPNPQDQIPPLYEGIRSTIIEEMKEQPLTPTHDKSHAPANRLIQARASLKSLLSDADIEFLVDYDHEPPLWAAGATQRNSRIDNFMTGLEIREWGLDEFIEVLCDKTDDKPLFYKKTDKAFIAWLTQKSTEWLQELYALLGSEARGDVHRLKTLCIVRLADETLSRAGRAFFASENTGDDVPIVDKAVYTSGTSKKQQEDAQAFLSSIGVREVGEAEEIEIILKSRYAYKAEIATDEVYLNDLKRFVALVEKQADKAKLFAEFYVFRGEDDKWYPPGRIYLDKPYINTDLAAYYGALSPEGRQIALHDCYRNCGIEIERLGKFAKTAGAKVGLEVVKCNIDKNPQKSYLLMVGGSRASSVINRDYYIPHLAELLKTPSLALSRLVWRTLLSISPHSEYLHAIYQLNRLHGAHHADSLLVHELRDASWVPQADGVFVRPADASRELLPNGFPFDSGYTWVKAIRFGEAASKASAQALQRDAAAKNLGFANAAAADRARRFNELPEEDQEAILAELESRNKAAMPDRPLANPERRSQNVREQALNAPNKETEMRQHSVSIGREDVKEQAGTFLREHYRNADGEMTCQICKRRLPFKLDDGREYFEVVEFLPELRKRHPQNYLALCPNHSAMYRLVNGSRETMWEAFQSIEGNELPVVLAEKDMTIYFSKTHIIDLKAVLEAEEIGLN
jgi:hypothetical protein